MAKLQILAGATSVSVSIFVQDTSKANGSGLTGFATAGGALLSGMIFYYSFEGANAASVSQSLSVPATVGAAFSAGSIVEIDATHMPGVARLDLPNAMLASGKGRSVVGMISGGANVAPIVLEIELTAIDNQSTGFGLSNVSSNVVQWNGTNVSSPATAGIPDINVKNIAGSVSTGAAGYVGIDWGHVNAPTSTVNLSGTTTLTLTDLTSTTYAESSAVIGATATLKDSIVWLKTLSRNKVTQTATTETLYANDGATVVSTSTDSDNGTIFTRGVWS